ncbi:hypothetical protein JCM9140_4863 [Halalkalibacter wakoensis JCM 9140]|uniref:Uncharacterized protein n=1 Tax=Halalkalibacter wakoensis JCM 9140 TaxID=1236970 RepID=W4Q9G3_9BACI|nr:hypothetical protein JCM9140_4863 [Halalkalibacter wakoensis JCM 9140]
MFGERTKEVFKKYNVPLTKQTLKTLVGSERLYSLLQELNSVIGSSTATCIEGG